MPARKGHVRTLLGQTHDPLSAAIQLMKGATEFRVVLAAQRASSVVPESGGCRTLVVMVLSHLASPLFGPAFVALRVVDLEKQRKGQPSCPGIRLRAQDTQELNQTCRLWG